MLRSLVGSEMCIRDRFKCGVPVPADGVQEHESQICPYRVVPGWVHRYTKPHSPSLTDFCRHSPTKPTQVDPDSPSVSTILEMVDAMRADEGPLAEEPVPHEFSPGFVVSQAQVAPHGTCLTYERILDQHGS
eukprot:TRINITY_DN17525_c0_g2_i1.p1 TRINITY_DN17525_c0_g2~~TRINITY_DN17525_c0_g2_i1.p1  ORF type:complete len:132 (-),score=27.16 TRINITY_DN17525_c0_g2_i1:467-862(-)